MTTEYIVEITEEPKTRLPRSEIEREIFQTLERLREESLNLYQYYNRDFGLDELWDFELEDFLEDLKCSEEQLREIMDTTGETK